MFDNCCDGHRAAGLDVGCNVSQLWKSLLRHLLDEDVEDPAAGQANRERVVVADPVALQDGVAVCDHFLRKRIDRGFHAAA